MPIPSMKKFAAAVDSLDDKKINSFLREDDTEETELKNTEGNDLEITAHSKDSDEEETVELPQAVPQKIPAGTPSDIPMNKIEDSVEEDNYREEVQEDNTDINIDDFEESFTPDIGIGEETDDLTDHDTADDIALISGAEAEQVVEPVEEECKTPVDLIEEPAIHIPRSELAQKVIDSVFANYDLTSINVSYFGAFAANMLPDGYYIQTVGNHSFFIKESTAPPLGSIISLLDKIRAGLKATKTMQIPLTYPRNLEGSTMYALIITEREIQEIIKSFPDLRFAYTDYNSGLEKVKLMVTARR